MNIAERPRFRNDLVAHPFNEGGQLFVEVTDPDSGQTFKFYEVEYALASAMDGRRDVGGLVAWAAEELGVQTSTDELQVVISTLGDLGYLAAGARPADRVVPAVAATPVAQPESAGMDVELGLAGAADTAARVSDAYDSVRADAFDLGTAGSSPVQAPEPSLPADVGMSLELGSAGKSDMAVAAKAPPSLDVKLGMAGAAEEAPPPPAPIPTPEPPVVAPPAPPPVEVAPPDEESFAGLMDDRPAVRPVQTDDFDVPPTPPPAEVPIPKMVPRSVSHDDDEDGPTNLPSPLPEFDDDDVSVDLSEHLSINTADVQEAVRASKVMDAVEIPDDLLAELEAESAPPPPSAETPLPSSPPPGEPPPVELPGSPPKVSREIDEAEARPPVDAEPKPVEKKRGTSPVLIVLLLLVMVGAAAAYYFLVYKKDDSSQTQKRNKTVKGDKTRKRPGTDRKKPPKAAALPTAKLVTSEPEKEDVVVMKSGPIAWLVEDGAAVASGDVIAKIRFNEKKQKGKIRTAAKDQGRYHKRVADWTKEKGTTQNTARLQWLDAGIARETKKIADRQQTIDTAQAIIDSHNIKTPAAGVLETFVAERERVKEGQTIAAIAGEAGTAAEFTPAKGKAYEVNQSVKVAKKAKDSADVDCTVTELEAGKVLVECPPASGLAAGDEVVLK